MATARQMAGMTETDANKLSPIQQAYIQKRRNRGQKAYSGSMDDLEARSQNYAGRQKLATYRRDQNARNATFKEQIGAGAGSGPSSAYEAKKARMLSIYNDPDLQAYNDSYGANFGAARAAVENAFANAMGEINQRGAAGGAMLDAMPGNVNRIYGDAQTNMQGSISALAGAQAASGLQPLMDPNTYMAPLQAANSQDQAGRLAAVPLLRTGMDNALSKERQSANSEYQMALADIAEREASARQSSGGLNAVGDELLSEEAHDQADQAGGWGQGYLWPDRGGDIIQNRKQTVALLRAHGGSARQQMAYDSALELFNEARAKGKKLDSGHVRKIMNQLRAKFGKNMTALNLALVDAGYSG